MKKSNALIFLIFANVIMFFIDTGLISNITIRIQVSILAVGYFIVKQLEENSKNNKKI